MYETDIEKHGSKPVNIQWKVVRGDTASIVVEFLLADEKTFFNTTGWTYKATAYDPSGDFLDPLSVQGFNGYAIISAAPSITRNWGVGFKSVVAELPFDLQVKIPAEPTPITWTPVIGTISVIGDVTVAGSL